MAAKEKPLIAPAINTTQANGVDTLVTHFIDHTPQNEAILIRSSNWKIENAIHSFSREDSNLIRFAVKLPREGETVIRYAAHYSW